MSAAIAIPPVHDDLTKFLKNNKKIFIGGKWGDAASGKTFATLNPATGEVLAQVAEGDRADIDAAVRAARKAFEEGPWSKMTASERGKISWKIGELVETHAQNFASLDTH